MIVFPNAKINIGLDIINRRQDGFHDIVSCFFPLPFFDVLEAVPNSKSTGLEFEQTGIELDNTPQNNLVVRAYDLLSKDYKLPDTKAILYKNIPPGAGLGGGSADAAFMLQLLNTMYELCISQEKLYEYASLIGSDCSFFLYNKPALIEGRGDKFVGLSQKFNIKYIVLIMPGIHISTAWAYSKINPKQAAYNLQTSLQAPVSEWKSRVFNDFEPPVFKKHKKLHDIKEKLYKAGAFYASLTGTGSTVYGLFLQQPDINIFSTEQYFIKQIVF